MAPFKRCRRFSGYEAKSVDLGKVGSESELQLSTLDTWCPAGESGETDDQPEEHPPPLCALPDSQRVQNSRYQPPLTVQQRVDLRVLTPTSRQVSWTITWSFTSYAATACWRESGSVGRASPAGSCMPTSNKGHLFTSFHSFGQALPVTGGVLTSNTNQRDAFVSGMRFR